MEPIILTPTQADQEVLEAERLQAETTQWIEYIETQAGHWPIQPDPKTTGQSIDIALFALLEDNRQALATMQRNIDDMEQLVAADYSTWKKEDKSSGKKKKS